MKQYLNEKEWKAWNIFTKKYAKFPCHIEFHPGGGIGIKILAVAIIRERKYFKDVKVMEDITDYSTW